MLMDELTLLSLPPLCASFMVCKRLANKQPKLMRSHLMKLGIYEFTWVLYWLGVIGVVAIASAQNTLTSPLGVISLMIVTVSGLAVMNLMGMGMGVQLKNQGRLVTHQDQTLLKINILLIVSMMIFSVIN